MESQKELAWKMRGILMDWLIQVHSRFKLLPETLFLCVNLIDRFLSARVVSLAKLQLVGVTCMFIASKVEETVAPSVKNFIYCADSAYTEADILQAEKYILKTIEWNLSYPSPLNFLRRISKADQYNVQTRTVGKYLLEIGCLEWRLLAAPPSLLAAAAMWLARLVLDFTEWVSISSIFRRRGDPSIKPRSFLCLVT
jgi:G2/mitotic-specific cyclin 1/2